MRSKRFFKGIAFGVVVLSTVLFSGCSRENREVLVGRDATWFPVQFGVYNANVNAFLNALISEINERERTNIVLVNQDWIHLFENLDDRKTSGAVTSLYPGLENRSRYNFSEPFLLTGPVLVVQENSPYEDMASLKGKIVGIYKFDSSASVAQDIPGAIVSAYKHVPVALESLSSGCYDALLVPVIEASALVSSVYKGRLKIISKPLTEEGLRLIAIKGENDALIDNFNSGLVKLRRQGKYDAIKKQYRLP
ncbi:transporter substrate-binding domain-containing protein [Chlamydiifrater phoenicopteri]|uniref:amino acid ABC transporter substrate-binding protein n=1 Tax=Chlamydiifrater phoenicopteri TaxID=2681469 RepID=UPI001FE6F009|nr:transporter substrate-binding domain-containing protein [Chlamydiifrater phoenicopteri]